MVFIADDLAVWLIGALADAGRKKITAIVVGTDQERALRSAATAAVQRAAGELRPGDAERAEKLARLVNRAFIKGLVPGAPMAGYATLLEALQAGIAGQLAVWDDTGPAAPGRAPAEVVEVPGPGLAGRLTAHLLREIVARGARGGPLFPLASQLNDDVTHLQGQRLEGMVGDVLSRLARLDVARSAAAPTALAQLPPEVTGFTGRDDELAVLAGLLDPDATGGPVLVSAVAGLAGVGKTTGWRRGMLPCGEAGSAAGCCSSTCTGMTRPRWSPGRRWMRCCGRWGCPAEHIPPTVEERAGLYRSVLAQVSEPVLVIADNASSEAQVRPLLPGAGPHKVVVTSRHTLAGLDARLVDVTVLDDDASVGLLDGALRAARPEDDRITADAGAAGRLAGVVRRAAAGAADHRGAAEGRPGAERGRAGR